MLVKPCDVPLNRVKCLRWDKGDINGYRESTFVLLSKVCHVFDCSDSGGYCSDGNHIIDIDIMTAEITNCLHLAAKWHIPNSFKSAQKHYWSVALSDLKSKSIEANALWRASGKPRHGHVFNLMKNAKYTYKLAIKDARRCSEESLSDDILDHLARKDMPGFWKQWNAIKRGVGCLPGAVDNATTPTEIANKFATLFKTVSDNAYVERTSVILNQLPTYDANVWSFNDDDISHAIGLLKCAKAAGAYGITPEHIKYAHPVLTIILRRLFNLLLKHSVVPRSFGAGIIIPLLKDRLADASKVDNYRAITLSSIISKVFELCVLDKCKEFFSF